ncbi:MAG: protein-glutamate O-methyltransferase CheR [Fimbriimonadaceae bacterium]|nr:protein-glutamate O-methyltransferase CheR [Fimbriimonadaceae bacterium]
MHLNEQDWQSFYSNFKRAANLDLNQYKQEQLRRRIISMADTKGCKKLDDFWLYLKKSPENIQWFQDKMAINVSELFRNPEKWVEMQDKVLPELIRRNNKLKVWSAGCSYGAEAHTLAAILQHKFKGFHSIVGSDIDDAALAQARSGEFNEADMRCVPAEIKGKYFTKEGDIWRASPEIKKCLTFRKANLLEEPFDANFDLIMCRNVVIYFNDDAKDKLYERFFRALKPGGVLFVGSTERIFNGKQIGFEQPISFFYQKPMHGETEWRNAS